MIDKEVHSKNDDANCNCKNIEEIITLDDVELQQNIDNLFLVALSDAGEVGYQKEVNKWNEKWKDIFNDKNSFTRKTHRNLKNRKQTRNIVNHKDEIIKLTLRAISLNDSHDERALRAS
jgi:hypothetical protein